MPESDKMTEHSNEYHYHRKNTGNVIGTVGTVLGGTALGAVALNAIKNSCFGGSNGCGNGVANAVAPMIAAVAPAITAAMASPRCHSQCDEHSWHCHHREHDLAADCARKDSKIAKLESEKYTDGKVQELFNFNFAQNEKLNAELLRTRERLTAIETSPLNQAYVFRIVFERPVAWLLVPSRRTRAFFCGSHTLIRTTAYFDQQHS